VAFHLFLVAFSYQKFIVETVENTLFSEAKKSHQKKNLNFDGKKPSKVIFNGQQNNQK
jgi:hypothetical protein